MTTAATLERRRFADELIAVGPSAPTLCEGWDSSDLAAHVVLRDRRPDAMPGVLIPALSSYTRRVQDNLADGDWTELVAKVRSGPPIWSPTRVPAIDRLVNTAEFFVHLEDVRRAQPGWEPRELDPDLADDLDAGLRRSARLMGRKAPSGLVLEPDGGRARIEVKSDHPIVVVRGAVGELVLFMFGRQAHAKVAYDGPSDAVKQLRTASFGI